MPPSRKPDQRLQSERKRPIITEMQRAIAREFARRAEAPNTMPQRIADLLRELHRRLRDASRKQP